MAGSRIPGWPVMALRPCGKEHAVSTLEISVAAGEAGPVMTLAGEADLTSAAALGEALAAQLSGARQLTVDLSGLRFADSASVRALVLAGRALAGRGGGLVLLRPQPAVARVLAPDGRGPGGHGPGAGRPRRRAAGHVTGGLAGRTVRRPARLRRAL
jgi:anti-anti-sigma factor